MEYTIITYGGTMLARPGLVLAVNEAINEGWIPIGGPFMDNNGYLSQAMIKN